VSILGFCRCRCTAQQVVKLKDGGVAAFQTRKKNGITDFVNLSDAYSTLWHTGQTARMLRLITNKDMIQFEL